MATFSELICFKFKAKFPLSLLLLALESLGTSVIYFPVKTPELRVTENGKKTATVTLAVPRNYKNASGEYETDFLDCTLWTNIAENTTEYCQTGDMVGVNFLLYAK